MLSDSGKHKLRRFNSDVPIHEALLIRNALQGTVPGVIGTFPVTVSGRPIVYVIMDTQTTTHQNNALSAQHAVFHRLKQLHITPESEVRVDTTSISADRMVADLAIMLY